MKEQERQREMIRAKQKAIEDQKLRGRTVVVKIERKQREDEIRQKYLDEQKKQAEIEERRINQEKQKIQEDKKRNSNSKYKLDNLPELRVGERQGLEMKRQSDLMKDIYITEQDEKSREMNEERREYERNRKVNNQLDIINDQKYKKYHQMGLGPY